jgi:hypothetical protein
LGEMSEALYHKLELDYMNGYRYKVDSQKEVIRMQRIDPNQAKPRRLMLVLDDLRYEFVLERASACLMSPTDFLRALLVDDSASSKKISESDIPGLKENRINLILPDKLHKVIEKKTQANKLTKAGYMRALIDTIMIKD